MALLGLVLLGFSFWGARSLWDSSEARYGQVALEMLNSGDWLVPTLAGEPHLTKPPFSYWMIAAGMKFFGPNAWGARFFLSVFFTATLFCVRELALTLAYDRKEALAAAFIFGTSIVPFMGGHTLTTDAFLTFWETLGVIAAWKVWQGAARQTFWRLVFWGAFGMGFFTKGPPALLPLVTIAVYLGMRRDRRRPSLVSVPGMALFAGLAFWWFGFLIARDPNLLPYFWGEEVIGRIASNMHDRNDPFWVYIPVIVLGVGPWMLLWPRVVVRMYRGLRQKRLFHGDRHLFLLLWFVIPMGAFLLARSRMPLYVMPLFVPLSLVLTDIGRTELMPRIRQSPSKRRAVLVGLAAWIAALAVFTAYPDNLPGSRSNRPTARVFAAVLDRMEEPIRLYWVYAGHQKYSIPFYMQRVVANAEGFDRHPAGLSSLQGGGATRVLYITKSHLLPRLLDTAAPPMVHAQTRKYALIEWPRQETPAQNARPNEPGDPPSSGSASRKPLYRPASRSGLFGFLLGLLAGSRH